MFVMSAENTSTWILMDFAHWWRAVLHLPQHHPKVKHVDVAVPRALSVKAVDEDFVATSVRDSSSWSAGEYVRNAPVSLFMLIFADKKLDISLGWFKGKPHISWEKPWFPVDFPLNQSIEY